METTVLILIVVDNGLVRDIRHSAMSARQVLILIVVDNGLVPLKGKATGIKFTLS